MILFALDPLVDLARSVADLARAMPGRCALRRFANGELHATIDTPVAGEDVALVASIAPPDTRLVETLLVAHTLARHGARSLIGVIPYLAYARQDRDEPGKSLGAAWVGELLRASGVTDVVTVDVHSAHVHALFPIAVRSLSPAGILACELAALGLADPTVVAPDEGALERCEAVRRAAQIARPVAHFTKRRTEHGITHSALHGEVTAVAVIVDDILDTGGTLVSAAEGLRRAGVDRIVVMVTHGLFTGERWRRLRDLGVERIYCTDTTPPPEPTRSSWITPLSVGPVLAEWLAASRLDGSSTPGHR